ncbi:hypothetical protein CQA66_04350 [Helicobacter aurati]|uniref:Uncharacterized protein n=1 Tax=Helicobacter aurati TaxID=137778 RepID=A0A3D8J4X8_9HELI|nr:hypothetical protein [Helicobacter aurati]RDU72547.1 hypothetical protein CQA66_04350 [Helicobacter aurati]
MSNRRTFWPLGILFIILLGIILIVVSVRISSIQSIAPDSAFSQKKLFVDTNINELMNIQNRFETFYIPYLGINKHPNRESIYKIQNPYYVKPPAPKTEPQEHIKLKPEDNMLFLVFAGQATNNRDGQYPLIKFAELEFVRLNMESKEVESFKVPLHEYRDEKIENNDVVFESESFSLPLKGFYQARFSIHVQFHGDTNTQKVFFYHWVFNT